MSKRWATEYLESKTAGWLRKVAPVAGALGAGALGAYGYAHPDMMQSLFHHAGAGAGAPPLDTPPLDTPSAALDIGGPVINPNDTAMPDNFGALGDQASHASQYPASQGVASLNLHNVNDNGMAEQMTRGSGGFNSFNPSSVFHRNGPSELMSPPALPPR